MWERRLRLSSGLIIAAYVITHFYNHGFGIIALDAMESFRFKNAAFWQHPAGSIALYGAFTLHFGLALWSLYRRRTLRMPLWEAAQLGLGLAVPFMLAGHVVGTRINQWLLDFDVGYPYVVTVLWNKDWLRTKQMLLLLIVWSHFCVGMHFWLRLKRGYRRAAPLLFAVAVVFPVLALTGFARAGLETEGLMLNPDAASAIFAGWNAAAPEQRQLILDLQSWTVYGFAGIIGLVLAARGVRRAREKRRGHYRIRHVSGRVVSGRVGQTVLETLRQARVPHASVCGGRGRCTTCRIRVGDGIELLASPSRLEIDALQRIAADPNVRLACQTRPAADLSIVPLVPSDAGPEAAGAPGGVSGREQRVAAMFVDLRESTKLGEGRLPYDVVFILNQFFAEMSAALAATGGHYAQFAGDGLMALYGMRTSLKRGCQQALYGAIEMNRRLEELNTRLAEELDSPLRMGIGVHCGDAIVGTMGPPDSPNLSAVGDNVNIAARLESQSKVLNAPLVISTEVADEAGVALDEFPQHLAPVRGRGASVAVFAVSDFARLEALLDAVAGSAENAAGRRGSEGA